MVNFYLFALMCIFLIILPGPDTAVATRNTLSAGRMGGLKTAAGTCSALAIHTLAAVAGLSALIVKSAMLFSVLKYAGAAYLVYLGIKSLLSIRDGGQEKDNSSGPLIKGKTFFRQGFLTNLLNPKVAVFFLTFLPQFVEEGTAPFFPFLLMGAVYTILTAVWFFLYVLLIQQISSFMKKPKTQKAIEGLTGTILIGFGVKLALEKAR
ncbi:LysE family translocator [Bacillus infantis]|uniref:LysE family translocator n=1 Tax=Bacillus infantis TaxID=324767 RepID=UPI001CD703DE|nr:LysE family translocator [Bacillus infantis]MCA1037236.1 LysE family translocator [Bacillus infantis]